MRMKLNLFLSNAGFMQKFYRRLVLASLLSLALMLEVNARIIYVSNTGNDTRTLTQASHPDSAVLTVSRAHSLASDGDEIRFMAGTYSGNLTVTKRVTFTGAGMDVSFLTGAYTVTASGGSASNRIVFQNLTMRGANIGLNGITLRTSFFTMRNVTVTNYATAIMVNNQGGTAPILIQDIELINCKVNNNGNYGFQTSSLALPQALDVEKIRIINCEFNRNDLNAPGGNSASGSGLYFQKGNTGTNPGGVSDVLVKNVTVNNNRRKGIYAENLRNAVFENVTIINSGWDDRSHSAGIDFNFIGNDYAVGAANNNLWVNENITLTGLYVTRCGLGDPNGAGIIIKARNESGVDRASNPATVKNLQILRSVISGNRGGIRLGESSNQVLPAANGPAVNMQNVVIRYCQITNNGAADPGPAQGKAQNFGFRNFTTATVDARFNNWGRAVPTYQFLPVLTFSGTQIGGSPTIDGLFIDIADIPVGSFIVGTYADGTNNTGIPGLSWNTTSQSFVGTTIISKDAPTNTFTMSANATSSRANFYYVYRPQDLQQGFDIQKVTWGGKIDSSGMVTDSFFVYQGTNFRGSFPTLSAAAAAASTGDTIQLANGLPADTSLRGRFFGDISLPSGVTLLAPGANYGGYTRPIFGSLNASGSLGITNDFITTNQLSATGPFNFTGNLAQLGWSGNLELVSSPYSNWIFRNTGSVQNQIDFSSSKGSFSKFWVRENAAGILVNDSLELQEWVRLDSGILSVANGSALQLAQPYASIYGSRLIKGVVQWKNVSAGSNSWLRMSLPFSANGALARFTPTLQTGSTSLGYWETKFNNSNPRGLGYSLGSGIDRISQNGWFELNPKSGAEANRVQLQINTGWDNQITDGSQISVIQDNGTNQWVNLGGANGRASTVVTALGNGRFSLGNKTGGPNFPMAIVNVTAAPSEFCLSDTGKTPISVSYSATGPWNATNTFTLQLSDSTGSFVNPVNLGSVVGGVGSGTINGFVPFGTKASNLYRVRIDGSQPDSTGGANSSNLVFRQQPIPPSIVLPAGGINFCQGDSVKLKAPLGFAFKLWSTGSTADSIWVKTSSHITLQVGNVANCLSRASNSVFVRNIAFDKPAVAIIGTTTFCRGGKVILKADKNLDQYTWNNNSSLDSLVVTESGKYAVRVRKGSCNSPASDTIRVTVLEPAAKPIITKSGPTTFCNGDSVVLTAPLAVAYKWDNGAITRSVTVKVSDTLKVSVDNGTGCFSANSDSFVVKVNPIPIASISASTQNICVGDSAVLTAPAGMGAYIWSTGGVTQSIVVKNSGVVTLSVVSTENCTSSQVSTELFERANGVNFISLLPSAQWNTLNVFGEERSYGFLNNNFSSSGGLLTGVNPNPPTEIGVIGGPVEVNLATGAAANNYNYGEEGALSSVQINGRIYFTTGQLGGIRQINGDFATGLSASYQAAGVRPSSITSDGQFIYSNSELNPGRIYKYQITATNPFRLNNATGYNAPDLGGAVKGMVFKSWGSGLNYIYASNAGTALLRKAFAVNTQTGVSQDLGITIPGTTAVQAITLIEYNGATYLALSDGGNIYLWQMNGALATTSKAPIQIVSGVGLGITGGISGLASRNNRIIVSSGGNLLAYAIGGNQLPFSIAGQPKTVTACSSAPLKTGIKAQGAISYQWQRNGIPLSNGASLSGVNSDTLLFNQIFSADSGWYKVIINNGCSNLISDSVLISPIIPSPKVRNVTFCRTNPNKPPLTYQGLGVVRWYSNRNGTGLLATGNSFAHGVTAVGTRKFFVTDSLNGCTSPIDSALVIVTNPNAAPTVAPVVSCVGASQVPNLVATGTGLIRWYSDAALTQLVFVGNSFTHGRKVAGNYFYYVTDSVNGCTSPITTAALTILPEIPTPAAFGVRGCFGQTIPALRAQGSGTLIWYGNSVLTQRLATGTTFNHGRTAVGSYAYWVVDSIGNCKSSAQMVSLTIQASPNAPSATNVTACQGTAIPNLTATAPGVIRWFSDAARTQLVNTGTIYVHGRTAPGTYNFFLTQEFDSCFSAATTVSLTITPQPSMPVVNNVTVCAGSAVPNFQFTGTGFAEWFSDAALSNRLDTGVSFGTGQVLPGTYSYYVTRTVNGCRSLPSLISLTIQPKPEISLQPRNTQVCQGSLLTLNVDASAPTALSYQWLKNGTPIFGETSKVFSLSNAQITDSGRYSVNITIGSCEVITQIARVTVNSQPLALVNTDASICPGGQVSLGQSAIAGLSYQWSSIPTGFVSFDANPTVSPNRQTRYLLTVTNTEGCTQSNSIQVNVLNQAPAPTLSGGTACILQTIPNLKAQGSSGGKRIWYSDAALSQRVFEGDDFATGQSLVGTYTYYVIDSLGGCFSTASSTSLIITPAPNAPRVTGTEVCLGQVGTLNAIGTGILRWYNDAALTQLVGVGSSIQVNGSVIGQTGFYVTQTEGSCQSLAAFVALKVKTVPSAPITTGASICEGEPMPTLLASGAGVLNWYADANKSVRVLANGTQFTPTTLPSGLYTYYVEAVDSGCTSELSSVQLRVNSKPRIIRQPVNVQACIGQPYALEVSGENATNYQWLLNGSPINGKTSRILDGIAVSTSEAGSYSVILSNDFCISTSVAVQLTIDTLPVVSLPVQSAFCFGESRNIGVTEQAGFAYNWSSQPSGYTSIEANPTVSPRQNTRYLLTVTNLATGCSNSFNSQVNVKAPVLAPELRSATACVLQATPNLTASGAFGGKRIWFTDAILTQRVFEGDDFATGKTAVGQYTYYVVDSVNGCFGPAATTTLSLTDAIPAPITVSRAICEGDVIPSVKASGAYEIEWWAEKSRTTRLGFGSDFTPNIGSPATYTYYVTQRLGDCISPLDSAQIIIKAKPLNPVTTGLTICEGDAITPLTATRTGFIEWFASITNPVRIDTGVSFTPSANLMPGVYTYYVRASENNCISEFIPVNFTVIGRPVITQQPENKRACSGSAVEISAFADGATGWTWTKNGTPINGEIRNAIRFESVSLADTGLYQATLTNGLCSIQTLAVRLKVDTLPLVVLPPADTLCVGASSRIGVIEEPNLTYAWTSLPTGFTSAQANPLVSPQGFTRYFLTVTNSITGCVNRFTTFRDVFPVVETPRGNSIVVCELQTIPKLIVSGAGNGKRIWFADAGLTNRVFEGDSFTTGKTLSGTYSYFVIDSVGECRSSVLNISLKITNGFAAPITRNFRVCDHEPIPTLTVSGPFDIEWFADKARTQLLGFGANYRPVTAPIGANTYYVNQRVGDCISPIDSVVLTVYARPSQPNYLVGFNPRVCEGEPVPALGIAGSGTMRWYSDVNLTQRVWEGTSFNTGRTAPGSYKYWVTATIDSCTSLPREIELIIEPKPLIFNQPQNLALCPGSRASFAITSQGANRFQWLKNGAVLPGETSLTLNISNVVANDSGDYRVVVYNTFCNDTSNIAKLRVYELPVMSLPTFYNVCPKGTVDIGVDLGNGFTYDWISSPQGFSASGAIQKVGPNQNTTYILRLTELSTGCSNTFRTEVRLLLLPVLGKVEGPSVICIGERQSSYRIGKNGHQTLSWTFLPSGAASRVETNDSIITIFWTAGFRGDASLTAKGTTVCGETGLSVLNLKVVPRSQARFEIVNPRVRKGELVQFRNLSTEGGRFFWDFGNRTYSTERNPVVTYDSIGKYTVTLVVSKDSGCADTARLVAGMEILPPQILFVPTAFTPNGNGENDVLYLRGEGLRDITFRVFAPNGEPIFETKDQSKGWDGKINGGDAPSGNYMVSVTAIGPDGVKLEYKGTTSLLR